MADPTVTQAFFDSVDDPGGTGWRVRVALSGDGFVSRAAPLIATVGEVPVQGFAVIAGGAIGFLAAVPPAGARLRIGYLDRGLEDTDITFGDLPNA